MPSLWHLCGQRGPAVAHVSWTAVLCDGHLTLDFLLPHGTVIQTSLQYSSAFSKIIIGIKDSLQRQTMRRCRFTFIIVPAQSKP